MFYLSLKSKRFLWYLVIYLTAIWVAAFTNHSNIMAAIILIGAPGAAILGFKQI
jgi:hypothetical protein